MFRFIFIAVLSISFFSTLPLSAETDRSSISIGPSFSYIDYSHYDDNPVYVAPIKNDPRLDPKNTKYDPTLVEHLPSKSEKLPAFGLELSYAKYGSRFSTLTLDNTWFTGGFHYYGGSLKTFAPYVECGFWFLATFGAGYELFYGKNSEGNKERYHRYHIIIGEPIPIFKVIDGVYLFPYYRHTWEFRPNQEFVQHELGLMIKYRVELF